MPNPHTRLSLDPRARLGRRAGRRFLLEWVGIGCLGIAVILLSSLGRLTASVDNLVYDRFLSLRAQPLLRDIVVLEIDNASIAQLGRWPWPRSVHARLLEQIAKAKPAAVIYDVLFTEANPEDAQLARAIALSPTYLPVLLTPPDSAGRRVAVEPVAPLAHAAAGLGHINLEVDSDGIVRSVARFEGDADSRWPQLMVPVAQAVERGALQLNESPHGQASSGAATQSNTNDEGEGRFLIPFGLNAQNYSTLSFASVLAGDVPADMLRGRIVLIGVTASGLYDRFATPVSGELGPLPGVYIHANVLDTLLTGRELEPAEPWVLLVASLAPLAALLAGFLVLSPRRSLVLTVALGALATAGSAALLYGARLWMSPVPAIFGLIVVYPIWNWRRLEMTMAYLREELQRLADEPHLLPETPQRRREFGGDVLEQHMALMAQAAQRVQDMKRFVWDSLDSMPEPILVSDVQGIVLIANHAAKAHFARLGAPLPEGRPMRTVLGGLTLVKTIDNGAASDAEHNLLAHAQWPALLDPARHEFASLMAQGVEVRDAYERDHLLRYANCTNEQGETTGWIAGLVDVSALHAAERQREDALRLLSHDMRSPQASILALVEIERARSEPVLARELLERIERYAQRALTLADDFVQLARAESQAYVLEPVSMTELMIDASDEVWPQAHAKRITLQTDTDSETAADEGHWICADRSLMTRALVNILNNAVKYSPPDTRITCSLKSVGGLGGLGGLAGAAQTAAPGATKRVSCTIRDEGYGIPEEQQAGLFERFRRFHETERPEVGGAGLGMAFVKTVVTRHGGEVDVVSAPGKGTVFTISLPALDEAQTDASATPRS
ncbi:CHASE2 domain-containing protein [Paraburkholderia domus]|uniref:histidine kinase n=1 Tax=Paraburkholderia domus TaxID=2793075 RepID=A0A9N8QXJ0_9BURK|nr:CHASE2 domain-containing protein [Paraburkholderia domus]MBK5051412.1 CHASE2 domain-containing protein [Burkholderia sp. R-70006]MBK5061718.1 CHASE2 domain-containing protein [Burkholderia sp. R-70199]MBK5123903.1 CHASE2 domain-containing protein [Burkholderia sp. R-69980]MBK5165529.1 CHASE2 domain-containing protein [Burkholderia sp. R-70211]MBK5185101.1 CHASE2 domain-containing protein [Burkholderia sp. R-69749]MCI0148471.1 CHASE2 domain-containing protein [Paraburkholderia sediminicola]